MGIRNWLHYLTTPRAWTESDVISMGKVKLICIVNNGLRMKKGKIAAQVGHASVRAAIICQQEDPVAFEAWMRSGQQKTVLKVTDADEIRDILNGAKRSGFPTCKIYDAGRTQIPAGSLTVGTIGPSSVELVDEITGDLKLL